MAQSTADRKCEEISSTFLLALEEDRDYAAIICYADNCGAQNKNWTLFTVRVELMNSGKLQAETPTVKYLEKGHMFMSADTIHARFEKALCKAGNVYDFQDFCCCVDRVKMRTVQASWDD